MRVLTPGIILVTMTMGSPYPRNHSSALRRASPLTHGSLPSTSTPKARPM